LSPSELIRRDLRWGASLVLALFLLCGGFNFSSCWCRRTGFCYP
jgi:hypothetical protein